MRRGDGGDGCGDRGAGLAAKLVDGAKSAGVVAEFVESPEIAGEWLKENLREGDVVLLKGSRGVKLERALEALKD
jgi:UDP-N-acetylmuramoyl-tripeptide--D-alanyl-D-alanine ligase